MKKVGEASNKMRAEFDGQDFTLYLDKNNQELQQLRNTSLQARLQTPFGGEDLGKIVTLRFGENKGNDGIELKYLPEGTSGWENIQEVKVTINDRAYGYVQQRGSFGTRYNGSDKIEIINGLPPETPKF